MPEIRLKTRSRKAKIVKTWSGVVEFKKDALIVVLNIRPSKKTVESKIPKTVIQDMLHYVINDESFISKSFEMIADDDTKTYLGKHKDDVLDLATTDVALKIISDPTAPFALEKLTDSKEIILRCTQKISYNLEFELFKWLLNSAAGDDVVNVRYDLSEVKDKTDDELLKMFEDYKKDFIEKVVKKAFRHRGMPRAALNQCGVDAKLVAVDGDVGNCLLEVDLF